MGEISMNNLTVDEKRALEIMQKDNFRNLSKDNVMQLVSILDKVDPEVAKEIIAQIPEALHYMIDTEKIIGDSVNRGIESIEHSLDSCYYTEDILVETLKEEIRNADTFAQKQYYIEKMEKASVRKQALHEEHTNRVSTILQWFGGALVFSAGIALGVFFNKANISIPKLSKV